MSVEASLKAQRSSSKVPRPARRSPSSLNATQTCHYNNVSLNQAQESLGVPKVGVLF